MELSTSENYENWLVDFSQVYFPGKISNKLGDLLGKMVWSKDDRDLVITELTKLLLSDDVSVVAEIVKSCAPIIIVFLTKAVENKSSFDECLHQKICYIITKTPLNTVPLLENFVYSYMEAVGDPIELILKKYVSLEGDGSLPVPCKKTKMDYCWLNDEIQSLHDLLLKYPSLLNKNWNWSKLLQLVTKLYNFDEQIFRLLIDFIRGKRPEDSHMSDQQLADYLSSQNMDDDRFNRVTVTTHPEVRSFVKTSLVSSDLPPQLVSVGGVLLQSHISKDDKGPPATLESSRVITEDLENLMRQTALAVSKQKPILLYGPSGCGKTSLVEYFARKTNRITSPVFSKIQMSDDTDSKTLTGTYVCTNVPGKFKWKEGLLVEACVKGYWVLMEDIDQAPKDVISLLLPLIESKELHVPGRSTDQFEISSNFRLFMTLRGDSSNGLQYLLSSSNIQDSAMIARASKVIAMNPISNNDLQLIMNGFFPQSSTACRKYVEIYEMMIREIMSQPSITMRKPSTRDAIKWMKRLQQSSISPTSEGWEDTMLSAADCFVAAISDVATRKSLIEKICSKLNISSERAHYYNETYTPNVDVETHNGVSYLKAGRNKIRIDLKLDSSQRCGIGFGRTRLASILLERLIGCVLYNEPVLLVGETGVGKTTALQYLAQQTGRKLHVVNMSQQSSSGDLLGGFRPVEMKHIITPVRNQYEFLFRKSFSIKDNQRFLLHIQRCFKNKQYKNLLELMYHTCKKAVSKMKVSGRLELLDQWLSLHKEVIRLRDLKSDLPIAFHFVQGQLANCMQSGDWLLLDEINLASSETLECLSGILESSQGSIVLLERGDAKPIERHPNFRIFAAMNPATDVGKRSLTEGCRNRFTEIFVDEPTSKHDLLIIVDEYLNRKADAEPAVRSSIVNFYRSIRTMPAEKLTKGFNKKPHYSLRTLCRALRYVVDEATMPLAKSLYEGFCLSFLTGVEQSFHKVISDLIIKKILSPLKNKKYNKKIVAPASKIKVGEHLVSLGRLTPFEDPSYIITDSVQQNLALLSRPVAYGKYPVLIEGPTSTGKTSLIRYMAALTGNKVVRINNHEHTDLQEYIGSYSVNEKAQLVFHDGPLVTAMREGHWIILDELNLAPTDILEALNRVLDDNRELFIPETQEVIRAHPKFMLFATQNPPGLYGGRKMLSRAFRNRFIELKFDEIPTQELAKIINLRCQLAPSHCKQLVNVMQDLQTLRKASGLFAGKDGFITLRDLFKWAERYRLEKDVDVNEYYDWQQHLAHDGYLLLAGRVRKAEEKETIERVLFKHFQRKIETEKIFGESKIQQILTNSNLSEQFSHVVWTEPMRRIFVTLERALRFNEPVLLVGETGGGKTTVCQMLAALKGCQLQIINCHSNTEAADFIGGLRPARHNDVQMDDSTNDCKETQKLFEWSDGPLVSSMVAGHHLLVDEISLAEDSVLERLNSVLETDRKLNVPDRMVGECSSDDSSSITATSGFQFMATMNPGGDFGKKELSPALRNRMTEIWCETSNNPSDLARILRHNLHQKDHEKIPFEKLIVEFVEWFKQTTFGRRFVISVRDLLTLCNFMNNVGTSLPPSLTYVHAACLVYIDGLGSGLSGNLMDQTRAAKKECLQFIFKQLEENNLDFSQLQWMTSDSSDPIPVEETEDHFILKPFAIRRHSLPTSSEDFCFNIGTSSQNAMKCLRALQLDRPILLEGSPGCGKTSLVAAIARKVGRELIRINLSEQTDISDLFGADLPVEDGLGGEFAWRDGPLLSAIKSGHWVVLDELNLAPQSILEGLNSVFDHRGDMYIPELGRSFKVDRSQTKIFACQNPQQEGGGRKGLPKSFLNRFTQVYVNNLQKKDLQMILINKYPMIRSDVIEKMIEFNDQVNSDVVEKRLYGHAGAPWEFNLRDLIRWCELILDTPNIQTQITERSASDYIFLLYHSRMRTIEDRKKIMDLAEKIFTKDTIYIPNKFFNLTHHQIQLGLCLLDRLPHNSIFNSPRSFEKILLPSMLATMESIANVLQKKWPCLITCVSSLKRREVIEILAVLSGNQLKVLSTNSSMDAIELLGGFEQSDCRKTLFTCIHNTIEQMRMLIRKDADVMTQVILECIKDLKDCEEVLKKIEISNENDEVERFVQKIESLLTTCLQLSQKSSSMKDIFESCKRALKKKHLQGRYEWSDSVLIDALRNGDWLMIDEANSCSPSVLDRLNGLLELDGVLHVTERGCVDGEVVTIKPHLNFRLILGMDPKRGELSRAMRNRCIEIFYDDQLTTDVDSYHLEKLIQSSASCGDRVEMSVVTNAIKKSHPDDVELVPKVAEQQLELYRQGFASEESMGSQSPRIYIPTPKVLHYIFYPALSSVLSRLKFLESINATKRPVAGFLQIIVEMTTSSDWKVQNQLDDKLISKVLRQSENLEDRIWLGAVSRINKKVQDMILRANQVLDVDDQIKPELPFDPRWCLKEHHQISDQRLDLICRIRMMITVEMLLIEEARIESEFCDKNNQTKPSSFYIAKQQTSFSHHYSSLTHLSALHANWKNILEENVYEINTNRDQLDDEKSERCESHLYKIFYLWKIFMTESFNKSTFGHDFLDLQDAIQKFVDLFKINESSAEWMSLKTRVQRTNEILGIDNTRGRDTDIQEHVRTHLLPNDLPNNFDPYLHQVLISITEDICIFCRSHRSKKILEEFIIPAFDHIERRDLDIHWMSQFVSCVTSQIEISAASKKAIREAKIPSLIINSVGMSQHPMIPSSSIERVILDHQIFQLFITEDGKMLRSMIKEDLITTSNCHHIFNFFQHPHFDLALWSRDIIFNELFSRDPDHSDPIRPQITTTALKTLVQWDHNITMDTNSQISVFCGNRIALESLHNYLQDLNQLSKSLWKNKDLLNYCKISSTMFLPPIIHHSLCGLLQSINHLFDCIRDDESSDKWATTTARINFGMALEPLAIINSDLFYGTILYGHLTKLVSHREMVVGQFMSDQSHQIVDSEYLRHVRTNLTKLWGVFVDLFSNIQHFSIKDSSNVDQKKLEMKILMDIGQAWSRCGQLQYMLLLPLGKVDPTVHHQKHLDLFAYQMDKLEDYLGARDQFGFYMYGEKDLDQHQKITILKSSKSNLKDLSEQLKPKIKPRSSSKKYSNLVMKFEEFKSGKLDHLHLRSDPESKSPDLQYTEIVERVFIPFITDSNIRFPDFTDLTHPLIDAVNQIRFGFYLMTSSQSLQSEMILDVGPDHETTVVEFLCGLARKGLGDQEDLDTFFERTKLYLNRFKGDEEDLLSLEKVFYIVLSRIRASATHYGTHNRSHLIQIFLKISEMWTIKCAEEDEKEKIESSLFRYKARVHDDVTDEEVDDAMMKEIFSEFSEVPEDLENPIEVPQDPEPVKNTKNDFSEDFYRFATRVFSDVILNQSGDDKNYFDADLLSYRLLASEIQSRRLPGVDIDRSFLSSSLLMTSSLQNHFSCNHPNPNVYFDATPSEAILCLTVLQGIEKFIEEDLKEFKDRPELISVMQIVSRIKSFAVTSPLMKFIFGLELLLTKAQDWETNSPKRYSLSAHLIQVTELIIKWRSLELKSWKTLLDSIEIKSRSVDPRWRFHLYNTIFETSSSSSQQDLDDLAKSLPQFIEGSNLLQFLEKLDVIKAVAGLLQLATDDVIPKSTNNVLALLHNLHAYYSQFSEACRARVTSLRTPIEKRLKDYIKIQKWNKLNYYETRAATMKTHKDLFKFTKEYASLLRESVAVHVLQNSSQVSSLTTDKEVTTSKGLLIYENWQNLSTSAPFPLSRASCLDQNTTDWMKWSDRHWPNRLLVIDEFVGEIIENFKELSKLIPPLPPATGEEEEDTERAKRLKEAKHIQSRKRRALSDLFKILKESGVSYRKGLVKQSTSVQMMQLPMIIQIPDLPSAHPKFQLLRSLLSDHHQSSFFKTLTRCSMLMMSLESPHEGVGVEDLQRLKGFANHLFQLVSEQRSDLSSVTEMTSYLMTLQGSLEKISEDRMLIDQSVNVKKLLSTRLHLRDIIHSIKIFIHIMKSGEDLTKVAGSLSEVLLVAKQLMDGYAKLFSDVLVTPSAVDVADLKPGRFLSSGELQKMKMKLKDFILQTSQLMKSLKDVLNISDSVDSMSPLLSDIFCLLDQLMQDLEDSKDFRSVEDEEIKKLELMSIDLKDTLIRVIEDVTPQKMEDQEETDLQITKVYEEIQSESKRLDISNIRLILNSFCDHLYHLSSINDPEFSSKTLAPLLEDLIPLMQNYLHVVMQTNLNITACHRSTSKLLGTLSLIFYEIASKGFCPPAEFEKELEEGAKGALKDVDDAGIGEGEGSKDVSDQIENEEQVEDTPGKEEEQDQGDSNIPAEDNAIEMTEDFDGKMQEPDEDQDRNDEEEESGDEEEPEKQMGDLGDEPDADKMDERIWGSEDEDEDPEERKDKEEEKGSGVDKEESKMGAKEDDLPEGKDEEEKDQKEQDQKEQDQKEQEEMIDESEFDPNERDDDYDKPPEVDDEEDFQLPQNMDVDDEDQKDDNEEEENPFDLDKKIDEKKDEKDLDDDPKDEDNDLKDQDDQNKDEDDQNKDEDAEKDEDTDPEKAPNPVEEKDIVEDPHPDAEKDSSPENEEEKVEEENKDEKMEEEDQVQNDQLPKQHPIPDQKEEDEDSNRDQISKEEEVTGADEDQQDDEDAHQRVDRERCQLNDEDQDQRNDGQATSDDKNQNETSATTSQSVSQDERAVEESREKERRKGKSEMKRSLADLENQMSKKLKVMNSEEEEQMKDQKDAELKEQEADLYRHLDDDEEYNQVALDAATEDQIKEKIKDQKEDQEEDQEEEEIKMEVNEDVPLDEDTEMEVCDPNKDQKSFETSTSNSEDQKAPVKDADQSREDEPLSENEKMEVEDEMRKEQLPAGSFHTNDELWNPNKFGTLSLKDLEEVRREMEDQLAKRSEDKEDSVESNNIWRQYYNLTRDSSQRLSEQLRLILEPTQVSKLRGDYRTGKRLNMRKVIPYIASGFRKDKIWLRRTNPNKRDYQIMIAIDNSHSMCDNHTKQLAFESLAVISNALSTIEAGQLSICSFGQNVEIIHGFQQPFTDQSGANVIRCCKFDEDGTHIGQLLETTTKLMQASRSFRSSSALISQLLIIISDGRGVFVEGADFVKRQIKKAIDNNLFIAFVVLDNPSNDKDSILDIKNVSFTSEGPQITSYMSQFPFPFYVVVRDVNALPEIMGEALRQWFELVTSTE